MLSATIPLAMLFQPSASEWDLTNILTQFVIVAKALTCGTFPIRHEEVSHVLLRLVVVLMEVKDDYYVPMVMRVLISFLSILLLVSRSMTSFIKLSKVGLSIDLLDFIVRSGVFDSNSFATGLIFLLQLQVMHQQRRQSTEILLSPLAYAEGRQSSESMFTSAARSLTLSVRAFAQLQRSSIAPSPDDIYFISLTFYAFNRQPMKLANTILSYSHSLSLSPHSMTARPLRLTSNSLASVVSIFSVDNSCSSDEDETIDREEEDELLSMSDASFVLFLLESYVLLFPGQVIRVAEVLSSTVYLPQPLITPVITFLAPHILTELLSDLRITDRNRCILATLFVNSVLAQTVGTCQYAMAARTLLKQMKISWTRAYVPVSVLPSNMYLFGARSEIFRLIALDDEEYMREMSLLFQNDIIVEGLPEAKVPTRGKRSLKK